MDILGYQSGHGDADSTLQWIIAGPPANDWDKQPRLFQINLEPAYENHRAYQRGYHIHPIPCAWQPTGAYSTCQLRV